MRKVISFFVGIIWIIIISAFLGGCLSVPIYTTTYDSERNKYLKGYYEEYEEDLTESETEIGLDDLKSDENQETNDSKYKVHQYKEEIANRLKKGEYVEELMYGERTFEFENGCFILNIQENENLSIKYDFDNHIMRLNGGLELYILMLPTAIFIFVFACYLLVYLAILIAFAIRLLKSYMFNQRIKAKMLYNDGEENEDFINLPTFLNIFELLAIRTGNYVLNIDKSIFDEYYQKRKNDSVLVNFYRSYYVNKKRSEGFVDQARFADRIKECVYLKLYSENYVKEKRDFKKVYNRLRDIITNSNNNDYKHYTSENIESEKDRLYRSMDRVTNYWKYIAIVLVLVALFNFWIYVPLFIWVVIELRSYKVRYTFKGEVLKYKLKQYEKRILKVKPEDELTIEEDFYKKVVKSLYE